MVVNINTQHNSNNNTYTAWGFNVAMCKVKFLRNIYFHFYNSIDDIVLLI